MPLPRARSTVSALVVVSVLAASCGGSDASESGSGQLNSESQAQTTLAVDSQELELDLEPIEDLEAEDFGADEATTTAPPTTAATTAPTTAAPAEPSAQAGSGQATANGATREEIEAALVEAHGPTTDIVSDIRRVTIFPDGLPTPEGSSIRTIRARSRLSGGELAVEVFVAYPGTMNEGAVLVDEAMQAAGYTSDSTSITDAGDTDQIDLTYEDVPGPVDGSGRLQVSILSSERGQQLWIRWTARDMTDNGFDRLAGWIGDDIAVLPVGSELTLAGIATTGSANSGALYSAEFVTGPDITTNEALEAALVENGAAAGMTLVAAPDELRSNVTQFSTSQFEKFEFTVGDDSGMITAGSPLPPLF